MEHTATMGTGLRVERVLGRAGAGDPCVLLFGGVHGNEPAGVVALQRLFQELGDRKLTGTVVALAGNLNALARGVRAVDQDLNRVWTEDRVRRDRDEGPLHAELAAEAEDFHALNRHIHELLGRHRDLYAIDLHTTSAPTAAFVTLNDTLANRAFVRGLKVPVVLGIEEHLRGPLLSWLMERGHVALAFESGQHADTASVERHLAFAWLALEEAGVVALSREERRKHQATLDPGSELRGRVFDIRLRLPLRGSDRFVMRPGYRNFDPVRKGEELATLNERPVRSQYGGRIFMPLYQAMGGEGYFLVRPVHGFWLALSAVLRRTPVHGLLPLLPGVERLPDDARRLRVDPAVARAPIRLFHLLGYRLEGHEGTRLVFIRRERDPRRGW